MRMIDIPSRASITHPAAACHEPQVLATLANVIRILLSRTRLMILERKPVMASHTWKGGMTDERTYYDRSI